MIVRAGLGSARVLGRSSTLAAGVRRSVMIHTLALDVLREPHYVAKSRSAAFVGEVASAAAEAAAGGVSCVRALTLVSVSEGEVSAVCPSSQDGAGPLQRALGAEGVVEGPFAVFRVRGPLDFGMVGVMAELSQALQLAGLSILAISTFDTDFVLVGHANKGAAVEALTSWGGPKYKFDVAAWSD